MRIRSSTPLHVIVTGILALAVMSQQLTRQQQGSGNACMQNCRMNLAKSNATLTLYWVALLYDEDEIMETVRIVMSFGFLKLCLHYRTVS